MNSKNLVKYLQANGFPEAKLVEAEQPQLEDDQIVISETIDIQVAGPGKYDVGRYSEKKQLFYFSGTLTNPAEIVNRINEHLKDEKNESI